MSQTLRYLLRFGLLAAVACAASACVVDPGYGYGPAYGPSVYVAPGPVYYGGYYHGGGYYHHGGYGYHHWH